MFPFRFFRIPATLVSGELVGGIEVLIEKVGGIEAF